MTNFQKNVQAAMDQFQQRLDQYGLEADRSGCSSMYTDETLVAMHVRFSSKKYPVKGNKKLMDQLDRDGLTVYRYLDFDRHMVFSVHGYYNVSCIN